MFFDHWVMPSAMAAMQIFYLSLAVAMWAHWQGRKTLFRRDLYEGRRASIKRVPGVPPFMLIWLSAKTFTLFVSWGSVIMCLMSAMIPIRMMRIATALMYTLFQISGAFQLLSQSPLQPV